jgi:hypothetical protein
MSRRSLLSLLVLGVVVVPGIAAGQVTVSNILQTRIGKDPDDPLPDVPDNRLTLFDQFNIDWFHDELRLGFRFETYKPSDDATLEYNEFSQRYAAWNGRSVQARVGNFEALFGRGVVLRAFELPGVIREEFGTPQFGDSRDLDGVKLQVQGNRFEVTALSGNPRSADAPPTTERRGLVSGGSATFEVLRGVRIGGEYLRLDARRTDLSASPRTAEVPGATLQLSLDHWLRRIGADRVSLDTFVEAARVRGIDLPPASSSPKLDPDEGRGFYFSQNVFLDEILPSVRWGMSWEYKDYQNFDLGVNEPPTLVREHSYALLNRNTHVVELNQEEGYQFESLLTVDDWSTLTLNWSRAQNRNHRRFREFYAELQGDWRGARLSAFHGDSDDESEGLIDRHTFGVHGLTPLVADNSLEVEVARLTATRLGGSQSVDFRDDYLAVTWAHAPGIAVTAVHQTTDDPVEATDRSSGQVSRRSYSSLTASLDIGNHGIAVFWGKRRGGLQCTAGTCYLVRAFDGVLVTVLSRF